MKIAIIGAGNVGGALGLGWARCGHAIRFGVANPSDPKHMAAADAANAVSPKKTVSLETVTDAARDANAVVLAVPWDAIPDVMSRIGPHLNGKLVLDATNPLVFGPQGLQLAVGFSTSGGEEIAKQAPGAALFKTMNQVGFAVMPDTNGYPVAPTMFVAGDDEARKPQAMALVRDLGFDAVDAGPLSIARLLEPYAMLWIDQAVNRGAPANNAFAFMRKITP